MLTFYKFKSLEDIAAWLARQAAAKREEIEGLAPGARLRMRGEGSIETMMDIAKVLQGTTLDPDLPE